jgi:multiple antibiotic resistance protein
VVPLTIPLLTGPATMSTVVIYADRARPSGSTRRWWATAW